MGEKDTEYILPPSKNEGLLQVRSDNQTLFKAAQTEKINKATERQIDK